MFNPIAVSFASLGLKLCRRVRGPVKMVRTLKKFLNYPGVEMQVLLMWTSDVD